MSTTTYDVPKECSQIALLYNGSVLPFYSTNEVDRFCWRMRLRITGHGSQGHLFYIKAQKEDNTL